jgi:hypothetical protein
MEHSIAGGNNSIIDEAFNGKISAFGSYQSSGHGAHSHIESRDTAGSSRFWASQRAIRLSERIEGFKIVRVWRLVY